MGYGFLGRALVKSLRESYGGRVKVTCIANSRGTLFKEGGVDLNQLPAELSEAVGFREVSPIDYLDKRWVDVLVELTPTNVIDGRPGIDYIRAAMRAGLDVVTANKGPLALAFDELMREAEDKGVLLRYEATVGGGIPVFTLHRYYLKSDKLISIRGILNGTSNYILTRMHFEGMPMDLALEEARMLGIAERDSKLDTEGIDTAIKSVILANSLLQAKKRLSDVKITGINSITLDAIHAAKEMGMTIKLMGLVEDGKISVEPRLIRLNHPLCVHGTLNAIDIIAENLGSLTLIGHGAGKSTVTALLSDLNDIARLKYID